MYLVLIFRIGYSLFCRKWEVTPLALVSVGLQRFESRSQHWKFGFGAFFKLMMTPALIFVVCRYLETKLK
jgi:hypothetical protein